MTQEQYIQNLNMPQGRVDVILDTDAFNEIDDQFAIALMLKSPDRFQVKAITAAPFFNEKATSPADGMEKSFNEIKRIVGLAGRNDLENSVYRGSSSYLCAECEGVSSDAADAIIRISESHTPEEPLYVIGIGAITNIASALLKAPGIAEKIVVLWLGGNAVYAHDNYEFNIRQDVRAARVVFDSKCPLILFPCRGVTDVCRTTGTDLKIWLGGRNPLSDYLVDLAFANAEKEARTKAWGRVIWDIVTVVWFLRNEAFESELMDAPVPGYDHKWSFAAEKRKTIRCITHIDADRVFDELYKRISGNWN